MDLQHVYASPEDEAEAAYVRAEREGMRLDSLLCPECPDPALCAAERECAGRAEAALTDGPTRPEWDAA
jgi:hypothetical protein